MMVTRVSLLLLVTGLFAGMWSADSPDERTAPQKQLARCESSPCAVACSVCPAPNGGVRQVSRIRRWTTHPFPLPRGIAPGTYLVVDQSGTTQRLTIAANDGVSTANFAVVEQYVVRNADGRWHFIRLETSDEGVRVEPVRQASAADRR